MPEIGWGCGEDVTFERLGRSRGREFEKAELAEVGDEDEAVMAEVAEDLRFGGEGVEVVIRGFNLCDAAFGVLERVGLGAAALAFGLREETTVGDACSGIAELGGKEDGWREGLADGVEERRNRRVIGGLGGCGAGRTDGS